MAGVAVILGALVVASPAAAFWSAVSVAPGSGAVTTATVPRGATPTVSQTAANSTTVTVSWTASTTSNGIAVTGYTVARYNSSLVAQTILTACTGTLTTTSCAEANVPNGLWTYTVTPRYSNWVGTASAQSAAVRVDSVAPVNNLSLTVASGGAYLTGTTLYYRGTAAGQFSVTNALTDTGGSGPARSSSAVISGETQWTHAADAVTTPSGGPYVSGTYSWNVAGTSQSFTNVITGADVAGNTVATSLSFTPDVTAPTGGATTYTSQSATGSTVSVTLTAATDSGSGVSTTTSFLQSAVATLSGTTCGTYADPTNIVTGPATATALSIPVTSGHCYKYQYVTTDNVGNAATWANVNGNVVKKS